MRSLNPAKKKHLKRETFKSNFHGPNYSRKLKRKSYLYLICDPMQNRGLYRYPNAKIKKNEKVFGS